jgi:hypothetical protein
MLKKINTTLLVLAMACTTQVHAQLKVPQPSPSQTVTQAFGIGEIKIEYSRPSVKGRVIFGDLVPYNAIWRTGANQSTKLTFTDEVTIGGKALASGTYALYSMPTATEWDMMIYKDLTLGGNVSEYKAENEVLRFKVKPVAINDKMEMFTIGVNNITPTTCSIDLVWDKLKVSIPVTTDIDEKVMKQIDKEMGDKRPYLSAANYYYDNNKDMNKALEWANKAVEANPKAYWALHTKAKIQVKLKDYKGAIKTAETSLSLAKEEQDGSYVKMNENLIAEAKKLTK